MSPTAIDQEVRALEVRWQRASMLGAPPVDVVSALSMQGHLLVIGLGSNL